MMIFRVLLVTVLTLAGASAWADGLTGPSTGGGGGVGCVPSGGAASNIVLYGAGGACTPAAFANVTNGALTLGASGTVGSVILGNATSGLLTLQPAAGALGAVTVSIPAATDTLVNLASAQALTNKTYNGLALTSTTGTFTLAAAKTLTVSNTLTFSGTDGSTLNIGAGGTLGALAFITPGTGIATALGVNVGSVGAPVLLNGAGGTPSSLTLTNATGLPVAGGGTGAATLTGVVKGNGTSPFTAAVAGTDYLAPAGSGAALTGLAWSQIGSTPTTCAGYGITNCVTLGGTSQVLTGGFAPAPFPIGTVTSGTTTIDCGNGPLQTMTNGGASTLALTTGHAGNCTLHITNNGSAGAITFSGFSEGSNTGDALTTTNAHEFDIVLTKISSKTHYLVSAYQ